MAFVSMCVCSDGPRAGLINEFTPPMWHCCDNQIPRQACSFPLRALVCEGKLCPCFMTRTLPSLHCVCLSDRVREREKESWLNNNRSTSVKLLILPKSLKWDLTHMLTWIHTHCKCWPVCMSRFNYITCGPDCGPRSVHRPLRDTRQSAMQK